MLSTKQFRLTALLTLMLGTATVMGAEGVTNVELYAPPQVDVVRERLGQWIDARDAVDPEARAAVDKLLATDGAADGDQLLSLVIRSFSMVDPRTRNFTEACTLNDAPLIPPDAELLSADAGSEFHRANVGLFYGEYLVRRRMYEEALAVLNDVNPVDVVDPASYFFHKAVCEHRLLKTEAGLASIDTLLNNVASVPSRYSTVATLMQYDLKAYEEQSLDEISRLMSDVERRLELGRAGQKVQKVEDDVIAKLDELIKKAEQNSSSASSSGQGRQNQNESSNPASDSTIKGDTAPGEIDPKKLKNQGDWGSLDPKEQEKVKNLINRNFPSNYRDAVEQYFKKLATRPASGPRSGR